MSAQTIKYAIIEDEERSSNYLSKLLHKYYPLLKSVGRASNVSAGVDLINTQIPDLIFLDVELPDGNGFDILKQVSPYSYKVIFVTGYNEHAIKAIKVNALDYLLKPLDNDELKTAVDKALQSINKTASDYKGLSNNKSTEHDKIVIHTASGIEFIAIKDIIYCKSDKNYTTFFLISNREVISSTNLGEYEKRFPNQDYPSSHRFFRSHKSFLVNLNYLKSYNSQEHQLELVDDLQVPLSQRKRSEFMKILER